MQLQVLQSRYDLNVSAFSCLECCSELLCVAAQALPGSLDVEKFAEVVMTLNCLCSAKVDRSCRQEPLRLTLCTMRWKAPGALSHRSLGIIDLMQYMYRADTTHRAWQQLPRHLRRRAASHDVRRVPLRLRDKARAEVRGIFMVSIASSPGIACRWMRRNRRTSTFPREGKPNAPLVRLNLGSANVCLSR